jgi:hypothetical protein
MAGCLERGECYIECLKNDSRVWQGRRAASGALGPGVPDITLALYGSLHEILYLCIDSLACLLLM